MDETKKRIQDFFQLLKDTFFSDVEIADVINMTEKEQESFILDQTERLLEGNAKTSAAAKLSGYFWTDKEGRNRSRKAANPLMEPKAREVMEDDERLLCSFYLTLAGFCHDLVYHYSFDPMVLGISAPEEFYVDNKPLVDFVLNTKYGRIAAHVACIMRKMALETMEDAGYQAARDYIYKVWYKEKGIYVKEPDESCIPSCDYAQIVIAALNDVEKHLGEGLKKGIEQNVIFVHDELFGRFMDRYDASALKAAREIVRYIDSNSYVRSTGQMSSRHDGNQMSSKERYLKRFADKVEEIRSSVQDENLFGSAAMKYLNGRIEQKFVENE